MNIYLKEKFKITWGKVCLSLSNLYRSSQVLNYQITNKNYTLIARIRFHLSLTVYLLDFILIQQETRSPLLVAKLCIDMRRWIKRCTIGIRQDQGVYAWSVQFVKLKLCISLVNFSYVNICIIWYVYKELLLLVIVEFGCSFLPLSWICIDIWGYGWREPISR